VDAEQRLPRERPADPVAQELMERTDAERPNADALDRVGGDCLVQGGRLGFVGRTPSQQDANIDCADPTERERERARRRRVEPLDVVDGDHERLAVAEQLEDVANRDGERPLIHGIALRVASEHHDLEGTPSRWRERRQDVVECFLEQIAEPYVSERLLRLSGARRQNAQALRARVFDPGKPERRLPDPRIAVEHEHRGAVPGSFDEPLDGGELSLPADDLGCLRVANCHHDHLRRARDNALSGSARAQPSTGRGRGRRKRCGCASRCTPGQGRFRHARLCGSDRRERRAGPRPR
jgi:hypothetical protein